MNDYVTELSQNLSVEARSKITRINVVNFQRRGNKVINKCELNRLLTEKTKNHILYLSGSYAFRRI